MRTLAFSCAILFLVFAQCCPSASTAPLPAAINTPTPVGVGRRVERAGIAVTVNSVKKAASVKHYQAEAGKVYLVVDVTIENAGRDEATPYNPMYCKVKDGGGFEYTSGLARTDQDLKSGELVRGEKARGDVVFEVPQGVGGLVLSYEPLVIFGGYEPIKIKLD